MPSKPAHCCVYATSAPSLQRSALFAADRNALALLLHVMRVLHLQIAV